jgi:hypothetical protein
LHSSYPWAHCSIIIINMANPHYANEFYDKAARAQVSATIVSIKANVCPFAIRLGWHAAGTFDVTDNSGGSDGATMRFEPEISDPANAGLGTYMYLSK